MPTLFLTGASRGLGLEFTRQYLAEGWTVHACARDPGTPALRDLADRAGDRLVRHRLDVADFGAIKALAHDLDDVSFDLVINNAGIFGPEDQSFGTLDTEGWMETFAVNTLAPVKILEALAAHVAAGGVIATVSSQMGSIADNRAGGYYAYRSSKAAVNAAMRSAAADLGGSGKIVVVVHPGWVRTDMGGAAAPLSPEQSVSALRRTLAGLTASDSGRFLNYDGKDLAY